MQIIEEQEIWKDIKGYEGLYQVSNMGRVKSLSRIITQNPTKKCSYSYILQERILKPNADRTGYYYVFLHDNGRKKICRLHRLVAISFIKESDLQVNHIDNNRKNNKLCNLEYLTNRENFNHYRNLTNPFSSKYAGVAKCKDKWSAMITINGKKIRLGRFNTESKANEAYLKAIPKNETKYSTIN